MVRLGDDGSGDMGGEHFLRLERVLTAGSESDTFADAENMRVHCHRRLLPDNGTNHVGRFPAHSRQLRELLNGIGHLSAKAFYEHACHAREVLRLAVRITHRTDITEDILGRCLCQGFGSRVGAE